MNQLGKYFPFPELINDVAARFVALGVLSMSVTALLLVLIETYLAYIPITMLLCGFAARVGFGPKFSPLALIVTKVIVPNTSFNEKFVPGPPKRFAQMIGLITSAIILISLALGFSIISATFLVILSVFAFLESALGYCFGCKIFKTLINLGLIPESTCELCANYNY
tara:strand:+ start:25494 stop:25994 length:501 start_codon:yes stop_codon:yes gene_type:complete